MSEPVELPTTTIASPAERARLDAFLAMLRERARSPATLDAYEKDWRTLARWYVGTTGQAFDLARLTPMDAADYLGFLARTAKPATASRRLLFLRSYLREARVHGHDISEELVRKVQLLEAPRAQPSAPRGLTTADARGALRAVEQNGSPRDKAVVFAFLLTGIRAGELCRLERRDLTIR